jgi:hypothetical protein
MLAWMKALKNWVHVLDQVICFKEEILDAILDACDRFGVLIVGTFNWGPNSPDTQMALTKGTYFFSKQIHEALQKGMVSPALVLQELQLLPVHTVGSLLGDLLQGVFLEHSQRTYSMAAGKASEPAKDNSKAGKDGKEVKQQGRKKDKQVTKGDLTAAAKPAGSAAVKQEDDKATLVREDKACHYYLSDKGCKHSEQQCHFQHQIPPLKDHCVSARNRMQRLGLKASAEFTKVLEDCRLLPP